MEKIAIGLVFILLNIGVYLMFMMSDKLQISKKGKILFFLVFLALTIWGLSSDKPEMNLIQLSLSMLVIYLIMGAIVNYVILAFFKQANVTAYNTVKKVVGIIVPIYTVFMTTVQLLLLFNVI